MFDNIGVKYSGKVHALQLKSAPKKYKVTTEWEWKLYIGIALKWEYGGGAVQVSIQGMYAQHYMLSNTINLNDRRTHHTPGHKPFIVRTIRCYQKNHQLKNWMNIIRKTSENSRKIIILCQSYRPHNVDGTKLPIGGEDKADS